MASGCSLSVPPGALAALLAGAIASGCAGGSKWAIPLTASLCARSGDRVAYEDETFGGVTIVRLDDLGRDVMEQGASL